MLMPVPYLDLEGIVCEAPHSLRVLSESTTHEEGEFFDLLSLQEAAQ